MKFSIAFLLLFFILISNLFSQKLSFCEKGKKVEYTNISTKNILVGFAEDIYIEDVDDLIEEVNLKIFTYKNDVLIIEKLSIYYREDGTVEKGIFRLSKKTKKEGLGDLILTLKEIKEILYANPFYYINNINDDMFAHTNSIIVKLNPKTDYSNVEQLAEKYDFEYEDSRCGNSLIFKIKKNAKIKTAELTCILHKTRYFEYVHLSGNNIYKRSPVLYRNFSQ